MIGQTAAGSIDSAEPDPKPDASLAAAGGSATGGEGHSRGVTGDVEVEAAAPDARSLSDDDALRTGPPREIGGRDGLEPTRYGDWEKNGRCIDF